MVEAAPGGGAEVDMVVAEVAVVTGGVLTLGVAVGHTFFFRLFGWAEDFARMGARNRRILYTIHVALYLLLLPFALVSLAYPGELTRPGIGGALALACAAFWAWRLVWQLVYFGPLAARSPPRWRALHRGLVALLLVLVAAYGAPAVAAWTAR